MRKRHLTLCTLLGCLLMLTSCVDIDEFERWYDSINADEEVENSGLLTRDALLGSWKCANYISPGFDRLEGALTVTFSEDGKVVVHKNYTSTITNSTNHKGTWSLDIANHRIVTTALYPGTIPMTTGNVWVVPSDYANTPIIFNGVSMTDKNTIIMNDGVFFRQ